MTSYTARRTPVHRGPAAWSAILPGQPAPLSLSGDQSVDVAIIGGGFAGLAAARRLRQLDPTLKVAVLEASRLAEGASGRNSGFMIDLDLHQFRSGLLRAILAIKETGYGSNTQRRVQAGCGSHRAD